VEKYGTAGQTTDDSKIRRMCVACLITKATNTHSKSEMHFGFPLQQWLQERNSALHYTYIACAVPYFTSLHPSYD